MSFIEKLVKIYKMRDEAHDIKFATEESACFDICAFIDYQASVKSFNKNNEEVTKLVIQESDGRNFIEIPSEWRVLVPTGLIFDIPKNHCMKVYPRSGLSTKKGLNLINSVGIIDSDYTEQLFIPLYNNSQERLKIYNGDRIAQGQISILENMQYEYTTERPIRKSDRNGGFGSTGV
jgi:dUTP pyrophosphatase